MSGNQVSLNAEGHSAPGLLRGFVHESPITGSVEGAGAVLTIYPDDIVVCGATFEELMVRLRQVLERIREANLQLNPSKCNLFQPSVERLGYVVSDQGASKKPSPGSQDT